MSRLRIEADIDGDLRLQMAGEILAAERAVTKGVGRAGKELQGAWRGDVMRAGLGKRLANTIRFRGYPEGEESIRAAALVWTRAPDIVHAFDAGVLIRSKAVFWLAIPLPAAGVRIGDKRMTPGLWEARTGRRLRFVYRRGRPSLLVADDSRISGTSGLALPRGGRRRRDGILSGAQTVPIFLLVPQVRMPKKLDIDRLARAAAARLPGLILANWKDS